MNKEEIVKEVITILDTSSYIDPAEHLYDGLKQIKREITYATVHDFLWALESSTVIDVDGRVTECANKIKPLLADMIIDEVYENFIDKTKGLNLYLEINKDIIVVEGPIYHATPRLLSQDEFINKCKTDEEFSQKWGLKIEERIVLEQVDQTNPTLKGSTALYSRKLITLTYNNETIESYE